MSEAPAPESKETEKPAEGEATEETGTKKSKKKLIIIIAAVVLLCGIGGGAFFFLKHKNADKKPEAEAGHKAEGGKEAGHEASGKEGDKEATKEGGKAEKKAPKDVFLNLSDFIVNLNTVDTSSRFLKIAVTLQLSSDEDAKYVKDKLPLVQDVFQTYLRELRPEDIQGSAGVYKLREELIFRLNKLLYPKKVSEILFREILMQ